MGATCKAGRVNPPVPRIKSNFFYLLLVQNVLRHRLLHSWWWVCPGV